MNRHRSAIIAVVALASLTACSSSTSTPSGGSKTSTQSAASDLKAALATIGASSYNANVTQRGLAGTASFDPAAKNAGIELKGVQQGTNVDIQALQIGADLYAKFDAGTAVDTQIGIDPTKWMKVDQSQLTGPNSQPFDVSSPDMLDVSGLVAGVVSVQRTSATELTGVVDLTKATGVNAPNADELTTDGAAATTTPFTVTLDSKGRLVELKIDADGYDKDLTFDIVYSSFGSATPLSAPATSDVVPAPAALYQLLNA